MTDFRALRAANLQRQEEWDPKNKITLTYRATELAGETGEACNIIKKLAREQLGIAGSRATVIELAAELADVVICADLVAMDYGINLGYAVRAKFNTTSQKNGLSTRIDEDVRLRPMPREKVVELYRRVIGDKGYKVGFTFLERDYDIITEMVNEVLCSRREE